MANDMTDGHQQAISFRELVIFQELSALKNSGEDPYDGLLSMPLEMKELEVKQYSYTLSTGGRGMSLIVLANLGEVVSATVKVQDISGITRKDVTDSPTWREYAQLLLDGESE